MDIEKLKCKHCGKFPDGDIYECAAKQHIVCVDCAEKSKKFVCTCGAKLVVEKQRNPIEQLLQLAKVDCRYEDNGCTWKFTASDMEAHVLECKFRPYRCVASTLNVLKCGWIGLQYDIENHLLQCHKELGPVFRFRESSSMVFKEHVSLGGLKLVDAFSKHFLFHFFSDAAKKTVCFLMVYFGRREESDQYCFELTIRSLPEPDHGATGDAGGAGPGEEPVAEMVRSVKFVERCFSDSENLTELLEEERCVVLTHRQIQHYLHNGKIYFNYKVRKVDGSCRLAGGERQPLVADAPAAAAAGKNKPRPPPFKFAEKGKASTNSKRSGTAASTAAGGSGSAGKSPAAAPSSTGSCSSGRSPTGPSSAVASRSPSSASTLTMSSERNSAAAAGPLERSHSVASALSSINRVSSIYSPLEKPEHCPLMTPSINRLDMPPSWTASQTTTSCVMYQQNTEYRQIRPQDPQPGKRYPPAECTTTATVCKEYTQPYKVQDVRPYLLKHPTNCLYKPQPKW